MCCMLCRYPADMTLRDQYHEPIGSQPLRPLDDLDPRVRCAYNHITYSSVACSFNSLSGPDLIHHGGKQYPIDSSSNTILSVEMPSNHGELIAFCQRLDRGLCILRVSLHPFLLLSPLTVSLASCLCRCLSIRPFDAL